jgi:hypothetical protein
MTIADDCRNFEAEKSSNPGKTEDDGTSSETNKKISDPSKPIDDELDESMIWEEIKRDLENDNR